MRKPLKILLLVLLVLVLVVGGYVIYVFASYDRIEDNQVLDVNIRSKRLPGHRKVRRHLPRRLRRCRSARRFHSPHGTSASALIQMIIASLWTGENIRVRSVSLLSWIISPPSGRNSRILIQIFR